MNPGEFQLFMARFDNVEERCGRIEQKIDGIAPTVYRHTTYWRAVGYLFPSGGVLAGVVAWLWK